MIEVLGVAYCLVGYLVWLSWLKSPDSKYNTLTAAILVLPLAVFVWPALYALTYFATEEQLAPSYEKLTLKVEYEVTVRNP